LTNLHKTDFILLACSLFEKRCTTHTATADRDFSKSFFPTLKKKFWSHVPDSFCLVLDTRKCSSWHHNDRDDQH